MGGEINESMFTTSFELRSGAKKEVLIIKRCWVFCGHKLTDKGRNTSSKCHAFLKDKKKILLNRLFGESIKIRVRFNGCNFL